MCGNCRLSSLTHQSAETLRTHRLTDFEVLNVGRMNRLEARASTSFPNHGLGGHAIGLPQGDLCGDKRDECEVWVEAEREALKCG